LKMVTPNNMKRQNRRIVWVDRTAAVIYDHPARYKGVAVVKNENGAKEITYVRRRGPDCRKIDPKIVPDECRPFPELETAPKVDLMGWVYACTTI